MSAPRRLRRLANDIVRQRRRGRTAQALATVSPPISRLLFVAVRGALAKPVLWVWCLLDLRHISAEKPLENADRHVRSFRWYKIWGVNTLGSITEARIEALLTVDQCIELCDITKRTWYRWLQEGAPRWAIRLVMSQRGNLDYLGWQDWEIRNGALQYKQLSYRYYWEPVNLLLPLYNVRESGAPWVSVTDKLPSSKQA